MLDYTDALNRGLHSLTTFVIGNHTLGETLGRVATLACDAIPGADVAGQSVGALNLYSHREAAFSADDEGPAMVFANQAAVALANVQAYWGVKARTRTSG